MSDKNKPQQQPNKPAQPNHHDRPAQDGNIRHDQGDRGRIEKVYDQARIPPSNNGGTKRR